MDNFVRNTSIILKSISTSDSILKVKKLHDNVQSTIPKHEQVWKEKERE